MEKLAYGKDDDDDDDDDDGDDGDDGGFGSCGEIFPFVFLLITSQ